MELGDVKDKKSNGLAQIVTREDVVQGDSSSSVTSPAPETYRLYKRRWLGLVGICLLNIVCGLNWLWFSSIAINTSQEFGVSLERVNWLGNSVNLIYLPVSMVVPLGFSRWGLRISCVIGSLSLLISAWIRYAGATPSLSPSGRYALLLIGQIFTGFAQPWFQILGPKYSETWFDLRGRTTATMVIAIANPIGAALSQLIAPAFSSVRTSVLILAIVTSVAAPTAIFIASKPPIPPTYAGSHPSPPAIQIFRAFIGKSRQGETFMSLRERLDMTIVTLLFGAFVGAFSAFSILINQIFAPYGYSSDAAGIMGGVLILAGIVGAAILSPVFDRYLTHHLALAAKILVPLLAASYIALIWDVRANNYAGLYVVMVVIGVASFTLLPIALEIGCEVTRSAETSSAVLWFTGNLLSVVFVLSMDALKDDSPDANPPSNMFKSLIFQGCFVAIIAISVFGLKGEQTRRELDVQKQEGRHQGEPRVD
ncbi:major facilitator superfamily domain-containing protein [Rhizoctonia solani]|nr:major facilitator superfamily domain-containing protein [Rhizoctonia solani]